MVEQRTSSGGVYVFIICLTDLQLRGLLDPATLKYRGGDIVVLQLVHLYDRS